MTSIAYESFWRRINLLSNNMLPSGTNAGSKYLEINPEGALLEEAQDIAEELMIMKKIYTEQMKVVKDFKRHIDSLQGSRGGLTQDQVALLGTLLESMNNRGRTSPCETPDMAPSLYNPRTTEETIQEAEAALELIESRQGEIQELEDSALRTCRQVRSL
jgi:hypothetical protein